MDEIFRALADPGRRQLLDSLNVRNGQSLRELCSELDMTRQSVSKHLAVLETANLITRVRRGREKLHYLNAEPINAIADRWISRYDRTRAHALADLKHALEDTAMDDTAFVYTTYVRTTPSKLWQGLTDPSFTRRYWGLELVSDWRVGSTVTWRGQGLGDPDTDQVVLESEPYRRLSYTWHTPTPEWALAVGVDERTLAALAAEPRSKATFDIEPLGEMVKLTVVHDGFEPDSTLRQMIQEGWPALLASLKTLLETGEVLPEPVVAEQRG